MGLRQLYYTSAKSGLSDSVGFQFTAMTPGVDANVLREVQEVCRYQPPPSAPAEPSDDQLADFPVAFSYLPLGTGDRAICRSVYAGTDFSGRFGNFFAHTLLARDLATDLGGRLPIDLWGSKAWADRQIAPSELAELDKVARGDVDVKKVAAFLAAGNRERRLPALLDAVVEALGPQGRQVVVVEKESETVALWLAAVCYSLPYRTAEKVSFTTYTLRPRYSPFHVVGISPDADFDYSPAELQDKYRVFDFVGGRFSPPAAGSFGTAALGLWREPARLRAFDSFCRRTGVDDMASELAGAVAALALSQSWDVGAGTVEEGARWAATRGDRLDEGTWASIGAALAGAGLDVDLLEAVARAASQARGRAGDGAVTVYLGALVEREVSRSPGERAPGSQPRWLPVNLSPAVRAHVERLLSDAIGAAADPRAAAALLQLTASLGVAVDGRLLTRLGHDLLGPSLLSSPDPALVSACTRGGGTIAWAGCLDFLEEQSRTNTHDLVAALGGALGALVAQPDPERYPALCMLIEIARSRGNPRDRLAVLDRLLVRMEAGLVGGARLDTVISLMWDGKRPTPEEAVALLHVLPHDLRGTGVPELLVEGMRRASTVDRHLVELAGTLVRHRSYSVLPAEDRALVEAVQAGDRFWKEGGRLSDAGVATELLAQSEQLPDVLRPWLARGICRWLLGLPPGAHARVVTPLFSDGRLRAPRTYMDQMEILLADRKRLKPAQAASVFLAWSWVDQGNQMNVSLLNDIYLPAMKRWSKGDLADIRALLGGFDPAAPRAWDTWREQHSSSGSVSRLWRRH